MLIVSSVTPFHEAVGSARTDVVEPSVVAVSDAVVVDDVLFRHRRFVVAARGGKQRKPRHRHDHSAQHHRALLRVTVAIPSRRQHSGRIP